MWFKRRKKTEQDHALSESLRSLQSLLSETGRHEPNVDPRHGPADDTDADESGDSRPAAGPALAANPGNGNRSRQNHHDTPAAEPDPPGGSGNRWRDLNLSFDAEAVSPRVRRDAGADDAAAPPESPLDAEPASGAAAQERDLADAETESAAPADPAHGPDQESTGDAGIPEPEDETPETAAPIDYGPPQEPARSQSDSEAADGVDTSVITDQNRDDDGYDFPHQAEDEFLVLDLEEPQLSPAAGTDSGAPSAGQPTDHQSRENIAAIEDQLPNPAEGTGSDDITTDAVTFDSPLPEPPVNQPAGIEQNAPEAEHEETIRDHPDTVTLDDDPPDDPLESALGEAAASEPSADEPGPSDEPATGDDDEQAEDQLHLELEASAVSEADIPVLTNAVYVPEPPAQKQEAPPGPPESPHEAPIARCIDNFRVRLQLMGLDTLSTAQEKELHDSLVEFLDEIEHD